jgi:ABC-type sugar transport system ATPase subunit
MSDAHQPNPQSLLEMRNISKSFPGVRALNDVSLQLNRGEVLALVGENGAGKSTLIKVLGGAHTPDSGELYLERTACAALHPNGGPTGGCVDHLPGIQPDPRSDGLREHLPRAESGRDGE